MATGRYRSGADHSLPDSGLCTDTGKEHIFPLWQYHQRRPPVGHHDCHRHSHYLYAGRRSSGSFHRLARMSGRGCHVRLHYRPFQLTDGNLPAGAAGRCHSDRHGCLGIFWLAERLDHHRAEPAAFYRHARRTGNCKGRRPFFHARLPGLQPSDLCGRRSGPRHTVFSSLYRLSDGCSAGRLLDYPEQNALWPSCLRHRRVCPASMSSG